MMQLRVAALLLFAFGLGYSAVVKLSLLAMKAWAGEIICSPELKTVIKTMFLSPVKPCTEVRSSTSIRFWKT